MDLIDRLREYARTRKGELAELITEAADALERQTCDDAVSRQAAIDAIKSRKTAEQSSAGIMRNAVVDFCIDIVKKLPSAQPEIVRCKDCRYHKEYGYVDGKPKYLPKCGFHQIYVCDDDFCSVAERRKNG